MGLPETLLLGFIAGVTIVFGLPVGRLRRPAVTLRTILNAVATGILLFLVWDVLTAAWEPIDSALGDVHDHKGGLAAVFGYGALFAAGITIGLGTLVAYEMWMSRSRASAAPTGRPGPGALAQTEAMSWRVSAWSPARRLALMIATGIGLHNFAEGLAIGNSAASGEIALAMLLIVGFGLHNATEGFGIVAPLAAAGTRPSWGFLATLGLIGGGPTFLGTLVGQRFTNETIAIAFLALAAGSILYVVIELLAVARATRLKELVAWGIMLGLVLGFVTDAIVSAAGA